MGFLDNILNILIEHIERQHNARKLEEVNLLLDQMYAEFEILPSFEERIKLSAVKQYQKTKRIKELMLFRARLALTK